MIDHLSAIPYSPDYSHLVENLDFGDEPFERYLREWIVRDSPADLAKGRVRVWLYANASDAIVGYGSLGTSNWRFPSPESRRVTVAIIPAVALRKEFWGHPKTAASEHRYSSQILSDLIARAGRMDGPLPAIGLYVDPRNRRAVRVYERCGFRHFHDYEDTVEGVVYQGFVRALP